jgi:hypothetical protein
MIVSQTPPQVPLEMKGVVGKRPGAAGERSHQLAQGQVGALDEGRLDGAGEVKVLEQGANDVASAEADAAEQEFDSVTAAGLEKLCVEQVWVGEPVLLAGARGSVPDAEVGGQGK